MTDHKILEETVDEQDEWVMKTTHPLITYDALTEQFIVDVGDGTWCEVWGKQRFSKAIQIADTINPLP